MTACDQQGRQNRLSRKQLRCCAPDRVHVLAVELLEITGRLEQARKKMRLCAVKVATGKAPPLSHAARFQEIKYPPRGEAGNADAMVWPSNKIVNANTSHDRGRRHRSLSSIGQQSLNAVI